MYRLCYYLVISAFLPPSLWSLRLIPTTIQRLTNLLPRFLFSYNPSGVSPEASGNVTGVWSMIIDATSHRHTYILPLCHLHFDTAASPWRLSAICLASSLKISVSCRTWYLLGGLSQMLLYFLGGYQSMPAAPKKEGDIKAGVPKARGVSMIRYQ